MRSDRELLELAAKAAGMDIQRCRLDDPLNRDMLINGSGVRNPGQRSYPWNPLTDDGDALRLAVKLSMEVYVDQHPEGCDCTEVWSTLHPDGQASTAIINHDADPNAATRRAIVRAAASLAAHPKQHNDGGAD